ncbi:MAG TPA: MFS transporter, partial [Acetobacteraceae bacterium]|nr:MFS transporter [Acetobacteraceae bacterium]
PELSAGFGLSAAAVASLVGLFYYSYAPFSLVAGAAMDRLGPRRVVPIGAAVVGVGALMFASGSSSIGAVGRLLQGAGGVFALIGAVYIATTHFPASRAATLIGVAQMFGMAGGFAGQVLVGPLIASGVPWATFWTAMGLAALVISGILYVLLPAEAARTDHQRNWLSEATGSIGLVLRNPQSWLCGVIAGLMFVPTSIFDMVWGVRYLQEAQGFDYADAVLRSSMVPAGWIVGCPLLGVLSDRLGRRKPVIIASAVVLLLCLAWILYGTPGLVPPYALGLMTGIASGAAMLPYTVIKEANPRHVSGSATGVIGFLNLSLTALLGPVFANMLVPQGSGSGPIAAATYQAAFTPIVYGVGLAVVLAFFLKETGPAVRGTAPAAGSRPS